MKHTILDIGHYKNDSGAVANGFKEVDLNYSIAKYAGAGLVRSGVKVTYTEGSLTDRTNLERRLKPDALCSIHNNSGGGDGTEVFHYPSSTKGKQLATCVLNSVISAGLNNSRGVKSQNLHMLRETLSPSALIECAFMDTKDIQAIDHEHERKAFGEAIAKGICDYLGVTYIKEGQSEQPKPPIQGNSNFATGSYGKKVIVTASSLNVRNGRGTEFQTIGSLANGKEITINYILPDNRDGNGNSDLWGSLDYNSKTGYIHMGYVKAV